jgi:hypothetical protein
MRLTLRTLLAYLDDTLPPSEAKAMGTKLAESEQAQEIVERIKNVIRRRRLTVPPAASRMDPNTIAEYLDNEITPEAAEELERICLAADIHLAEVSACHQILSLVLGEPTSAPDEAVKRMYALGKGQITAKPHKRAIPSTAITEKPHHVDREADETLRMGLPSVFGKDNANRALIFAGAALASLLLVVAIMQLMKKPEGSGNGSNIDQVADADAPKKRDPNAPPELIGVKPDVVPVDDKKVEPPPVVDVKPPEKDVQPAIDDLPPPVFSATPDKRIEEMIASASSKPPSTKVVPSGKLLEPDKDQVAVVVQQIPKTTEWKRLPVKQDLLTARPLVSLPGSKAPLVTPKGVRLTLWGNIPEHISPPLVQESMVELHDHDALHLDMTLLRGRILVSNLADDPIVVRIRFENPSEPGGPETYWFLTLSGKNAEAMIDRWSSIPRGEPFFQSKDDPERKGPAAQMACLALAGTVFLKTPTETATLQPAPNTSLALWSSTMKKLVTMPVPPPPWLEGKVATPPEVNKTRNELANAFTGKAVDVGLAEFLKSNDRLARRTAVRCLGAMDDLAGLLDMINQENIDQRVTAVETLIQWVALSRDNDYKLAELARQRLKANEADVFMTLLHGFSEQAVGRPETYELLIGYLKHNQIAIRELAAWNLYHMVPAAQGIAYDAMDPAKREKAYRQWLQLIPPGKLPPPAPPAPKLKAAAESSQEPRHKLMSLGELQIARRGDDLVVAVLPARGNARPGHREWHHAVGVGPRPHQGAVVGRYQDAIFAV